ncbi:MAG: malto-oligosyltrehalose trehalohydrolase [Actinobacteria bacterium]|nr:malto-oligosyltrehalose trehalohydrolase [Actinomycetota bacterium]
MSTRASREATSRLGATPCADGRTSFNVWAPAHERVTLRLFDPAPHDVPMARDARGYHVAIVDDAAPGSRYVYVLGSDERTDPASRAQPDGVSGPSAVADDRFAWSDAEWRNPPLDRYVISEIHVGTFTDAGTFDAAARELPALARAGIKAVEVMPIAEFPGARNWGYDGVLPYAAHHAYGGLDGFRRFVDAAHAAGLAVVLDVVYNHLGPEGNHLREFGPYFTDRYRTPWGEALNFDGPGSDGVRRYFVENACFWTGVAHVDALRLDAVHAIVDPSARPFVQELTEAVHAEARAAGRMVHVIAESAANDVRVIRPAEIGGLGADAQWNDDFHHALHVLLTGERDGYYADFGGLSDLARAWTDGFVYDGRYSEFRDRRHGTSSRGLPGTRFVVFAQNHDQVGNRLAGDRLSAQVGADRLRLAAATVLLSPFVPLLFQGDEYADPAPFPYFVSHTEPELVEAVRRGRREEFAGFGWREEPPDPQSEATFASAKLDRSLAGKEPHAGILRWHRALLELRAREPALARLDPAAVEPSVHEHARTLVFRRRAGDDVAAVALHFGGGWVDVAVPLATGHWDVLARSDATEFGGRASDPPHAPDGPEAPDAPDGFADRFDSDGEVELRLGPWCAVVLRRTAGEAA